MNPWRLKAIGDDQQEADPVQIPKEDPDPPADRTEEKRKTPSRWSKGQVSWAKPSKGSEAGVVPEPPMAEATQEMVGMEVEGEEKEAGEEGEAPKKTVSVGLFFSGNHCCSPLFCSSLRRVFFAFCSRSFIPQEYASFTIIAEDTIAFFSSHFT